MCHPLQLRARSNLQPLVDRYNVKTPAAPSRWPLNLPTMAHAIRWRRMGYRSVAHFETRSDQENNGGDITRMRKSGAKPVEYPSKSRTQQNIGRVSLRHGP